MSDGRPLFAFAFRSGLGHMLCDFADADASGDNVDFVWVHLDLSEATAQAWLRRRPWPADVIGMVAAPIQRGRLFITPDMVYGHLRDFRDPAGGLALCCRLAVIARHWSTHPVALSQRGAKPGRSADDPARKPVRADHGILSSSE